MQIAANAVSKSVSSEAGRRGDPYKLAGGPQRRGVRFTHNQVSYPPLFTHFLKKRIEKMRSSHLTNFSSNHYIPSQQSASRSVPFTMNAD